MLWLSLVAAGVVSRGLPFGGGGLIRGGWLAGWLWRGAGGDGMRRGRVRAEGTCANGVSGRRKQAAGMSGIGAGAGEGWVQVGVGGWVGRAQTGAPQRYRGPAAARAPTWPAGNQPVMGTPVPPGSACPAAETQTSRKS